MDHEWDFCFCRVNDALASVFLDLTLRETAPQPERPHLLWVWVSMRHPREDGLSRSEEAPQLHEIDDRLQSALGERVGAALAGRITTSGRREFYYYAPSTAGFEVAVRDTMSAFPHYRYDRGEQEDARWSRYLEVLYPSPRDLQRIWDRRVVERLKENSDFLHVPREVDHYLYFPSAQSRQAFVARVRGAGFAVRDTMTGDEAEKGLNRFGLRINRSHAVDLETIDSLVTDLIEQAEVVGGVYDGWETPVIREAPKGGGWKGWPWMKQ